MSGLADDQSMVPDSAAFRFLTLLFFCLLLSSQSVAISSGLCRWFFKKKLQSTRTSALTTACPYLSSPLDTWEDMLKRGEVWLFFRLASSRTSTLCSLNYGKQCCLWGKRHRLHARSVSQCCTDTHAGISIDITTDFHRRSTPTYTFLSLLKHPLKFDSLLLKFKALVFLHLREDCSPCV